jgi:hypothetical protein
MSAGIPDHIWQKFPRLKPLSKPPSLSTVNGFGLGVYGRRDYDQETETYVITRCLSALYLPLFALDAFRVADAGSRTWFFLGREPLSFFARAWNLGFGCLLAGLGLFIGVQVHTSSPACSAARPSRRPASTKRNSTAPPAPPRARDCRARSRPA